MTIELTCGECQAVYHIKEELAGRRGRCTKCGNVLLIPSGDTAQDTKDTESPGSVPPATDKQKKFAESLGIAFPPDINKKSISKLIDEAIEKRDEARYAKLDEIQHRESQACAAIREEIEAEVDDEDPRLSKASIEDILESLEERDITAILITCPLDEASYVLDSEGTARFSIAFTDDLDEEEMKVVLVRIAAKLTEDM